VTTVHIVDDGGSDREMLIKFLKESWDDPATSFERPSLKEWQFMWDLIEKNEPAPGDIVVADLYPAEYWEKAPPPRPTRERPLPEDPTNIYNATIDMIERFMRPATERSGHLVVLTYVPNFIESVLFVPVAATRLRNVLEGEHFTVFEKKDYMDPECFRRAVTWVNERLGA
jgi:hypothetical protein